MKKKLLSILILLVLIIIEPSYTYAFNDWFFQVKNGDVYSTLNSTYSIQDPIPSIAEKPQMIIGEEGIPVPPDLGGNILLNPDFESGTENWNLHMGWGTGTFVTGTPAQQGSQSAKVTLTSVDSGSEGDNNNVQLYQYGFTLKEGAQYRLSFYAKSSTGHDVDVHVHNHYSPFTHYGVDERADLTSSWQQFSYEFTANDFTNSVDNVRVRFHMGEYDANGDVYWFDQVKLEKIAMEPWPTVTLGPNVVANGSFENASIAPWVYNNSGGASTLTRNSESNSYSALLTVNTAGVTEMLYQPNISLQPYHMYRLTLSGYGMDSSNDMTISLIKHGMPYTNYGLNQVVDNPGWWYQRKVIDFATNNFSSPVTDGRLAIRFDHDELGGKIYFDAIELTLLDAAPPEPPPATSDRPGGIGAARSLIDTGEGTVGPLSADWKVENYNTTPISISSAIKSIYTRSLEINEVVTLTNFPTTVTDLQGYNDKLLIITNPSHIVEINSPLENITNTKLTVYIGNPDVPIQQHSLRINKNFKLDRSSNIVFLVIGDLLIHGDVTRADGMFLVRDLTDTVYTGAVSNQFTMEGQLITKNVNLKRKYNDHTQPSEFINFMPSYYFRFQQELSFDYFTWVESY